ncbi:hypothetical protein [Lacticaseibacillus rhamnosus]|uniref:hypothetical protein n=1 Tax=Lacticaseibacillus rhamnosus TaxID=47715 RepID=UPI0023E21A90|nr:hypothetical protein [Lacticaseibacillus rhamnosus]MDF3335302.1 hypothetical protein [Lacticaseibacillus rhamnosus]
MKLLYICEHCAKTRKYNDPKDAFDAGWDYPPRMGTFGVVSPRKCGECGIEDTLYWKLLTNSRYEPYQLDPQQQLVLDRIMSEPQSILLPNALAQTVRATTGSLKRFVANYTLPRPYSRVTAPEGKYYVSDESGEMLTLELSGDDGRLFLKRRQNRQCCLRVVYAYFQVGKKASLILTGSKVGDYISYQSEMTINGIWLNN